MDPLDAKMLWQKDAIARSVVVNAAVVLQVPRLARQGMDFLAPRSIDLAVDFQQVVATALKQIGGIMSQVVHDASGHERRASFLWRWLCFATVPML